MTTKREGIKGQIGGSKPGWTHSEETKAKLRAKGKQQFASKDYRIKHGELIHQRMATPQVSAKLSKSQKLRFTNPEELAKCASYGFKGKSHSPVTIQHMIKMALVRWEDPNELNKLAASVRIPSSVKYVQGIHCSDKAGDVYYRSTYELDFFDMLDNDCEVSNYVVEPLTHIIPYKFNNRWKRYLPDVLVLFTNGDWALIEIKPRYAINDAKNQAKFLAAESIYGDKFCVLTEFDIYD